MDDFAPPELDFSTNVQNSKPALSTQQTDDNEPCPKEKVDDAETAESPENNEIVEPLPSPGNDSDMTVMDFMIASAEKAITKHKDKVAKEQKLASKKFGKGMKTGFFGAGRKAPKSLSNNSQASPETTSHSTVPEDERVYEMGPDGFDVTDEQEEPLPLDAPSLAQSLEFKEQGAVKFKAKQYKNALKEYQNSLDKMPARAPKSLRSSVHNNCATCHFNLKDFKAAVKAATAAISFDAAYTKAFYRRGLAHQELGNLNLALTDLEKAFKLEPLKAIKNSIRSLKRKIEDIPTIKKSGDEADRLRLPEVQEAMAQSMSGISSTLNKGEWMTPELMKQMASNPRLAAGMQNPYFMQIMQEMQTNPEAAKKKVEKDPAMRDFVQEFMGIMGSHFEKMGVEETKNKAAEAPPIATPKTKEDEAVHNILANPDLRALLQDEQLKSILQECGNPLKFRQYMQDPVIGPKLKKMMDAGLVRIEQ